MINQNKKKILFLITKSNWGGAQRYVYDLATNLDRTKFEPVVALGGDGPLATMLENAHVRVIPLTQLKNSVSTKQLGAAYRELRQVLKRESPDILHLNSSTAGAVGALAGRLLRVPQIIFTAHGWAFNEDRPLMQKIAFKFFHYVTVLLSHRTIAVSRAIVTQMNWPGAHRRMKVINPGRTIGAMYDRSDARGKIVDFCPALSAHSTDSWLVCIAELHPVKRHHVLITAFSTFVKTNPTNRLVLIGEGQTESAITTQIKDLGLADHVFLLGNIIEAARFLKAFDTFILVSKSESYGYVLHEAGLAGIPIIATNVGGIPDIITHNTEGTLVPADDPAAIVAALKDLCAHPARTTQMTQTLHQKLKTQTVEKMTRQTESLYSL